MEGGSEEERWRAGGRKGGKEVGRYGGRKGWYEEMEVGRE